MLCIIDINSTASEHDGDLPPDFERNASADTDILISTSNFEGEINIQASRSLPPIPSPEGESPAVEAGTFTWYAA